jgi:hypothetical protein
MCVCVCVCVCILQSLSPRLTPRMRKNKPAPAPPLSPRAPSTPTHASSSKYSTSTLFDEPSSIKHSDNINDRYHHHWNEEKLNKDEANRNTQNLSCSESSTYLFYPSDKRVENNCKKKKGPAPPRPIPFKRKVSFFLSIKKKFF